MSKEEDVVELDEDISLLHSVFFEVNVANMTGESNIYPVEVSSLHPCSTSGGTFGQEAGHSLDPTWIDQQPVSRSHPECVFYTRF